MNRKKIAAISIITLVVVLSWALSPALMPLSAAEPPLRVRLETSLGDIVIELDQARAPQTTANFIQYVRDGFYDGTIFHRVINGFMIQGGGMTADMRRKETRPPILNEADNGLRNQRGTIAMARTGAPHSATSQFFINHKDNASLDHLDKTPRGWGYCVFGRVIEGMAVVDAIAGQPTHNAGMHQNVPVTAVVIKKALLPPTDPEPAVKK